MSQRTDAATHAAWRKVLGLIGSCLPDAEWIVMHLFTADCAPPEPLLTNEERDHKSGFSILKETGLNLEGTEEHTLGGGQVIVVTVHCTRNRIRSSSLPAQH